MHITTNNKQLSEGAHPTLSYSFVFNNNVTMKVEKQGYRIVLMPTSTVVNGSGFQSVLNEIDLYFYGLK
jgi:hypothetical protein